MRAYRTYATSVLKFVPPAGKVCGIATHAVGGNTGYGLLRYTLVLKFVPSAGGVCGTATHAVGGDAGYGLLHGLRLLHLFYSCQVNFRIFITEKGN